MAWFANKKRSWLESFCMKILQVGAIPKHVAFIMDGNRRFAKKLALQKIQGHQMGFEKLTEALNWCLDLGIQEVTLYTFSIENFKRSKEEVDALMDLFRNKLKQLLQDKDKIDKYEVRLQIIGNLSLLPEDIQKLSAEVMLYTRNYNKHILNVCMAYTSREEMTNGAKEIAEGYINGELELGDINRELFSKSLYSGQSSDPDLLVRTSGEVRLSDFLLWQSSFTQLAFLKVLWPEFTIWHLFLTILQYQKYHGRVQASKDRAISAMRSNDEEPNKERQSHFLNNLENKRYQKLLALTEETIPNTTVSH